MTFYLYASLSHRYRIEVALVREHETLAEAQRDKITQEMCWWDEGLRFAILRNSISPPPNVSYQELEERVMK